MIQTAVLLLIFKSIQYLCGQKSVLSLFSGKYQITKNIRLSYNRLIFLLNADLFNGLNIDRNLILSLIFKNASKGPKRASRKIQIIYQSRKRFLLEVKILK